MALTPYTDPQQVRAALGVSSTDITDETLNLPLYGIVINEGLRDVGPTLPTDLATTVGVPEVDRTPDQQRLVDLGGLYATYLVAYSLCASAPLFALKEMKDDRTADTRVDDPFKKLREDIGTMLNYVRGKLVEAYKEAFPGAVVNDYGDPLIGAAVPLALDPVTG